MRLLLDTHTFLWFIGGSPILSTSTRTLIEDPQNERLLSTASLWEMAIKASLGKLKLHVPFTDLVEREIKGNAIQILPITPEHLDVLATLAFHHKDPFDRLLVAQSISEGAPILSKDEAFRSYSAQVMW